MKKKNDIWIRISVVAGALFTLMLVLDRMFGWFGKSYEMVTNVKKIPSIEARVDTVEIKQKVQDEGIKRVDEKIDLLLQKWSIPVPPDTN